MSVVRARRALVAAGLAIAPWGRARAAAERLTDLAPVRESRVDLRWSQIDFRRGDADPNYHLMSAEVPRIEYRLDVSRYLGRTAKVYFVLPMDAGLIAPQGLLVKWVAQGPLRSGQGRPGERVVVFDGRLAEALLSDVLDLQLIVDSRFFTGRLRFNPYFEIEVN
jgi:hypothetical protein